MIPLPTSPVPGLHTIELTLAHAPLLQAFFDQNPEYFLATSGERAGGNAAVEEIAEPLPAGWHHTKKWLVGYMDAQGQMVAMANLITDLLADSVFHVGLFIVATNRQGSGLAQALYAGLEGWSLDHGASWMRLGVVCGNTRAERFWAAQGFQPVRQRDGIEMGSRQVSVMTMVKPLRGGSLDDYLGLVARDRVEVAAAAG